jgi:NAD+ diphosphatase
MPTDAFTAPLPALTPGFIGNRLDRADHVRRDPEALWALTQHPGARWLAFDGLKPVLKRDENDIDLLWLRRSEAPRDALQIFLGLDADGAPRFAVPGSVDDDLGGSATDARMAGIHLPGPDAAVVAQGRSLIDWHQRHPWCAKCGGATELAKGGYQRTCGNCGAEHFPRVDPVVIMLALKDDHALVGRQPGFPKGFMSALAGFVEPGESLEEAVARELWEEVGIGTRRVRYVASQPWPFPSTLMIGAFAEATGVELTLDETEIEAARWVTKDEARAALDGRGDFQAPPPLAIAHTLLKSWVEMA